MLRPWLPGAGRHVICAADPVGGSAWWLRQSNSGKCNRASGTKLEIQMLAASLRIPTSSANWETQEAASHHPTLHRASNAVSPAGSPQLAPREPYRLMPGTPPPLPNSEQACAKTVADVHWD